MKNDPASVWLSTKRSPTVLGYYGPERITCIDATEPPAKVLLHILESVNDGVNGAHESAAV